MRLFEKLWGRGTLWGCKTAAETQAARLGATTSEGGMASPLTAPPLTETLTGTLTAPEQAEGLAGGAPMPQSQPPRCFVGDLHGRADLLERLFAEIRNRDPEDRAEVIFLGDLIDRGPQSAAVLAALRRFCAAAPARRIALMGNHERMLLDFLADPAGAGPRWYRVGGEATLASYGLIWRHSRDPEAEWQRLAAALRAAMNAVQPPGLLDWLAARPLYWRGPGLQAAHAGSDPTRPLEAQGEAELLWGRRADPWQGPAEGLEIQGHVVVDEAQCAQNRVWLDTGAYRSHRLSALWLGETEALWLVCEPEGVSSAPAVARPRPAPRRGS